MDLRDFGSTLARWWYLTLATLLLATFAGVSLYRNTGPSYEADSTVLLLPPEAVLIQAREDERNYAPNNPLLYLSSLTDARDVLVRHLSSKDVTDALEKKAPNATISVEGDVTSGSPLILVKSEAPTETEALAGMKAVNESERTITANHLERDRATLTQLRLSRKPIRRGTSPWDEAVIDTRTTGPPE